MEINGSDLSIAKPRGEYFKFYRGRTANQHERDALEQAATWRVVDLVHRFGSVCPQATGRALSSLGLNTSTTRIQVIPPYFGALQFPHGGVWSLAGHAEGRNYSTDWNSIMAFRMELSTVAKKNSAVRAMLFADADLRALLNINETLVGSIWPMDGSPTGTYDALIEDSFPIDTRHDLPPYGGGHDGAALLDAVDAAHFATAGGPHSEETVAVARAAYEAGAGDDPAGDMGDTVMRQTMLQHNDLRGLAAYTAEKAEYENCRWFRRLAMFGGLKDPGWSPTELEQWERLTHVYYRQWSAAQRRGDTKAVTLNDHRHRLAHIALAIGSDDRLRIVMPADGVPAQHFSESYGGDQPCRSLLPQLVAAYNLG